MTRGPMAEDDRAGPTPLPCHPSARQSGDNGSEAVSADDERCEQLERRSVSRADTHAVDAPSGRLRRSMTDVP